MATIDEKWSALCDFIQTLTGWAVLKQKRPMIPQMNTPFIAVGIIGYDAMPKDRVDLIGQKDDTDNLTQRVRGLILIRFSIDAFGVGAMQKLKRLVMSFQTDVWFSWAEKNEFGYSEQIDIQDISAVLLDSNYEERVQITPSFYVPVPEDFDIDFFNKLHMTLETKGISIEMDVPKED